MIHGRRTWSAYLDRQHRYPTGLVGQFIGQRMLLQHAPETNWSLDLLALHPKDRLLELGCGAGRGLTLALNRLGAGRAVGADLSAAMLAAAAWRNRTALRQGRLSLLRADLAELPFAGPLFDAILSVHTFYFWPDQLRTSQRLTELLAPGGRLVSVFATTKTLPGGERQVWSIQQVAEDVVADYDGNPALAARLECGPDSRQFNNVALVIERR